MTYIRRFVSTGTVRPMRAHPERVNMNLYEFTLKHVDYVKNDFENINFFLVVARDGAIAQSLLFKWFDEKLDGVPLDKYTITTRIVIHNLYCNVEGVINATYTW